MATTPDKHTPTPWIAVSGKRELDGARYETTLDVLVMAVDDCHYHPIADCSCNHTCRDGYEAQENAAFIVRACNAHDGLISALRAISMASAEAALKEPTRLQSIARIALAKAEGRS